MKDWYDEIDRRLVLAETGKMDAELLDWCARRITWCWKWRKITREQMEELAERVIKQREDKRL